MVDWSILLMMKPLRCRWPQLTIEAPGNEEGKAEEKEARAQLRWRAYDANDRLIDDVRFVR